VDLSPIGEEVSTPDRYRPDHCPQCQARQPLIAHGFYSRTLVDAGFDGTIRVRRYLCRSCKRTVSLLPEFALPYLRFGITVISLFLVARLLQGATIAAAATFLFADLRFHLLGWPAFLAPDGRCAAFRPAAPPA
jgi:Domain of unknown function (DUF6431)